MKKRQIISLLIGCAVTAALAGCSTGERTQTTETLTAAESETVSESEVTVSAELEGDPSVSDESETAEIDSADEAAAKSLVVYFSWSGNTRSVAEEIQAQTDADLFEIVPAEPYTDDYNALLDLAQEEQASEARPEIAGSVENLEDYEVIYLGYPNWWGDMPMILYTFLDNYDLSGKTIAPFVTSGGSGFSGTIAAIESLEPQATVVEGLSLGSSEASAPEQAVAEWLGNLGLN